MEVSRAKLRAKMITYEVGETTSKIVPPMFEEF
jgi:hypothetical protein